MNRVEHSSYADDWRWLVGTWNVHHRRLRERLRGSNDWDEFSGRSALWQTLGGAGTIDDNELALPGGLYRAISIRAFDRQTRQWAIWWLDARTPGRLDPPVLGSFEGDVGVFTGEDTFEDVPILVRFRWRDTQSQRPWWEQAFSTDRGATWEVNWRNWFTRIADEPVPLAPYEGETRCADFDFLHGTWRVRSHTFETTGGERTGFEGRAVNWPVLGGLGCIGDFCFAGSSQKHVRVYNAADRQWLVWELDAARPLRIPEPMRGGFHNDTAVFEGGMNENGRQLRKRDRWRWRGQHSASFDQSISEDSGQSWRTMARMELERV